MAGDNAHCSASASITRRQPSSDTAATYFTSGEKTKSDQFNNSAWCSMLCKHNGTRSGCPRGLEILTKSASKIYFCRLVASCYLVRLAGALRQDLNFAFHIQSRPLTR